jgi:hypothetical protein
MLMKPSAPDLQSVGCKRRIIFKKKQGKDPQAGTDVSPT